MIKPSRRRLIIGAAALAAMAALPKDEADASLLLTGAGAPAAGGGGGPSFTTLNPSDKSADITLSGGNLTAGNTVAAWRSVRSIASISGLTYFEVTNTAHVSAVCIGLATAGEGLNQFPGNQPDTLGIGFPANDGVVYTNNGSGQIGSMGTWNAAGNIAACAINPTTKKLWFKTVSPAGLWNANASADPATGVGGYDYSALGLAAAAIFAVVSCNTIGDVATANFGASAFAGAVPSGYSGLS